MRGLARYERARSRSSSTEVGELLWISRSLYGRAPARGWHSIADHGRSRGPARPPSSRLPAVLERAARLADRHVDAERGPVVARARADQLPVPAGGHRRASVSAASSPLRSRALG